MNSKWRFVAWPWVLAACFMSVSASAQKSCGPSAVALPYCDVDGDLVADPPTDSKQFLDPDVIVIGEVPSLALQSQTKEGSPLFLHLRKEMGRKVAFFMARDHADLISAFRQHRVHVIRVNAGSVEQEVRCYGMVPLVQTIDTAGIPSGYKMELVVPASSAIKTVPQLRGHRLTFVDETSASGFKLPRFVLQREFGMVAGKDYTYEFSGRHDSSMIGVATGLHEAAAVTNGLREKMIRENLVDAAAIRVIYSSKTIPESPWGVSNRLHPAIVAKLRTAFYSFTGKDVEWGGEPRYRPPDYKHQWQLLRELAQANGTLPACR